MVAGREPARVHPARRRHLRDAGAGRGAAACLVIKGRYQRRVSRGRREEPSSFLPGPGRACLRFRPTAARSTQLTKPAAGADISPALSPDGGMLAFVRRTSTFNSGVFVMPLNRDGTTAGAAKQITSGVWDISTLDWTADGREILFAGSAGSGNSSLWRIARDGGNAHALSRSDHGFRTAERGAAIRPHDLRHEADRNQDIQDAARCARRRAESSDRKRTVTSAISVWRRTASASRSSAIARAPRRSGLRTVTARTRRS